MAEVLLQDVCFRYGVGPEVLSGVSLQARPGEVLGLLGVNGAGKTTVLQLVAGLLRPARGHVQVAGFSMDTRRREAAQHLGFVPHETLLYPMLSALENLNRFAWLWGVSRELASRRAESLLRAAGLWEERNTWIRTWSRGMVQKLSLCAALLHEPRVLLLDEPFSGLDMGALLWARELVRQRAAAGTCVLMSSHQPEMLDALADRLALLVGGRISTVLDREQLQAQGGAEGVFRQACQAREERPGAADRA